jgi:SAM-dependent methyltransferase
MFDDSRQPRETLPFGDVSEVYNRGRPTYPNALVDDVLELCDLHAPRVLEVGAGTGKATELFAKRELHILAIEPSAAMAAVARRNCAAYPRVSFLVSTFEDWAAEPEAFGLLISAQAWHWIDPEVRYRMAHQTLRRAGGLALFWSRPLWQESDLRGALGVVYKARAPELYAHGPWFPGFRGPHAAEGPTTADISGSFEAVVERPYRWALDYTTDGYLDLLNSLPEHLMITSPRRELLLEGVADVIEGAGGVLRMNYETRLYFARKP